MSAEDQLRAELDAVLLEKRGAALEHRDLQNAADRAMSALTALEGQAQRLRLALYALEGVQATFGDVNSDNHRRTMELLRGGADDRADDDRAED